MPVIRRQSPLLMLHRETMLNSQLSPHARLLYATLVAALDQDDVEVSDCLALVGLADLDAAQPYLAELDSAGLVDLRFHTGKEPALRVNEIPGPRGEQAHACVPCKTCGGCSCFSYRGDLCENCYRVERVRAESQADIARWQRQLDAGATYAYGQSGGRLHRWDCSTLNNIENSLEVMEHALKSGTGGHWPRLPDLYTAEELRQKKSIRKRCATCGPDPV